MDWFSETGVSGTEFCFLGLVLMAVQEQGVLLP